MRKQIPHIPSTLIWSILVVMTPVSKSHYLPSSSKYPNFRAIQMMLVLKNMHPRKQRKEWQIAQLGKETVIKHCECKGNSMLASRKMKTENTSKILNAKRNPWGKDAI